MPSGELPRRRRAGRMQTVFELNEVLLKNLRFAADALARERHSPADRADQHARYSRLFPEQDRAGGSDHLRCRIGQSLHSVRHLPHAGDGGRYRANVAKASRAVSRMSSSPTIPAATNPAPARSTIPSCSDISTQIGYRGWIGCEYKPKTTTTEGLGWYTAQTIDA